MSDGGQHYDVLVFDDIVREKALPEPKTLGEYTRDAHRRKAAKRVKITHGVVTQTKGGD
jgi:hypothetical protein